ncbi:MAG TPA: RluA family pseudouridine synthase [Polyangiaceae bacterium]|nr:RluA family pseudouridine synthase [Polyangiaceae bacterium]
MERRFRVEAGNAGERIDKFLVTVLPGLGRKGARRLFDDGKIRINGRRTSKGDVAREGDEIVVDLVETSGPNAVPEPGAELVVRLERAEVVVVEKPAGQATAPIRDGEVGTLANALVGRYPEMAPIGHSPREPGLVHRLDTDTSGLVVAARTADAFEALSRGLKQGAIEKSYLLVCHAEGLSSSGEIAIPIAHHPKDKKRMYACIHPRDVARYHPRDASTSFRVLRVAGDWALVEARARAAIRHQIRAHFAAIDHPLASDALYDGPAQPGLERHALHANYIAWKGDAIVSAFEVRSGLSADLAEAFPAFADFRDPLLLV